MTVHADDRGPANLGLTVLVLMPVDDQFWLDPVDFVGQRVEALVDAVFAVIECRAGSCGYHAIVVIPQYS